MYNIAYRSNHIDNVTNDVLLIIVCIHALICSVIRLIFVIHKLMPPYPFIFLAKKKSLKPAYSFVCVCKIYFMDI